jgi:hypothetical protein
MASNYRYKRLHVYANDGGDVTIHGELYVGAHRLTASEYRKLIGRVIRGIPKMLEGLPYCDLGFDNITIKRKREQ